MTPKEKAEELVQKMKLATDEFGYININIERHKQCALIAVDEIINCDSFFKTLEDTKEFTKYWYEIQQEINKL